MEVTKNNFNEQLEDLNKNLKRCCFIGFDAEFTAILGGDSFKYRLFDTNEERYNRMKNQVSNMIMTQVGLTLFQYVRDHDTYTAQSYTFHLSPQSFCNVDQSFIFQASTLKFLCNNNFNFNKFIYEGIPYLSKDEEMKVRQELKNNSLLHSFLSTLNISDEKLLQQHCSQVSIWLVSSEEGTLYLDVPDPILRYVVHNEIRLRYPNVLTTDSLGNSNKVLIYRDKYVEGANSAPMKILEDNLMNSLLGFSQVISLLEQYEKPIVGHNLFFDMILMHNQFIGPLPPKYNTFKKNIHKMLPNLYDTKYISHDMSKRLTFDEVWKSNVLQDLYEFFSEAKCRKLQNGVNFIKLSMPFDVKQSYHEAGWDSYCTGYCFIRLGHWAACELSGKYRPVGPSETLAALAPYCNKVNIIRASIPYMSFVENDPPPHRPELLHIKSLKEPVLNIGKVASILSNCGSVDIKLYGSRTALVATSSQFVVDRILKQFKDSREYRISKYSVLRHSTAGCVAIWGSALITGSLVLYMFHKK